MSISTAILGFPRMGPFRELKKAVEAYWKKEISESQLQDEAKKIRKQNWEFQQNQGITHIPSNDFSFYDQILDLSCMLGNVPKRFEFSKNQIDLETYFNIARGNSVDACKRQFAGEMTKWFDTNYHFIVPEFDSETSLVKVIKFLKVFLKRKIQNKTRPF